MNDKYLSKNVDLTVFSDGQLALLSDRIHKLQTKRRLHAADERVKSYNKIKVNAKYIKAELRRALKHYNPNLIRKKRQIKSWLTVNVSYDAARWVSDMERFSVTEARVNRIIKHIENYQSSLDAS